MSSEEIKVIISASNSGVIKVKYASMARPRLQTLSSLSICLTSLLPEEKPLYRDKLLVDFALASLLADGLEAVKLGWREYIQQPVLPASLAYVLLYFNVFLTPRRLMTASLTQRGLNPSITGGFSGLCAFMGVAATFISATLVERFGILKAGAVGLIFQASLLTIAVAVYQSGSLISHCNSSIMDNTTRSLRNKRVKTHTLSH